MGGFVLTVLAALVRVAGIEHLRNATHRYLTALMLTALALPALVGAIICALAALWQYALPRTGPVGAPLVVGGVLLLTAAALGMAAKRAATRPPPAGKRLSLPPPVPIAGGRFSGSGIAGLASAAIAGFLVGLVRGKP